MTEPILFVKETEMGQFKNVVNARADGYEEGISAGYRRGLATGMLITALFFISVYALGRHLTLI